MRNTCFQVGYITTMSHHDLFALNTFSRAPQDSRSNYESMRGTFEKFVEIGKTFDMKLNQENAKHMFRISPPRSIIPECLSCPIYFLQVPQTTVKHRWIDRK